MYIRITCWLPVSQYSPALNVLIFTLTEQVCQFHESVSSAKMSANHVTMRMSKILQNRAKVAQLHPTEICTQRPHWAPVYLDKKETPPLFRSDPFLPSPQSPAPAAFSNPSWKGASLDEGPVCLKQC